MNKHFLLLTAFALATVSAFVSREAQAAVFTFDCGASGSTLPLEEQIARLGSLSGNTFNVLGTCVGGLYIANTNGLTINNLSLTGFISSTGDNELRLTNLTLNGDIRLVSTRNSTVSKATVRGDLIATRGSQVTYNNLTTFPATDSTGTHDQVFHCLGQSECTLNSAVLTGTGTSTTSIGVISASSSRLNFYSGAITGFGTGLQVWNNAIAFVIPVCDPLAIRGNKDMGIFVSDSGMVKIEGVSAEQAVVNGCASPTAFPVDISANGKYGVLADGGGNAYLKLTRITGHTLDGVRVQNGSIVRVRASTIDTATTSRRSARVKGSAHLYFDEQEAGPTARSTLSGPICVTTSGTVETENSATTPTITRFCSGP